MSKKKSTLKLGKPDVKPDMPSHTKGVLEGNAVGNYEAMNGHNDDHTSTADRSTGINPGTHSPIDPRMPNLSPA